MKTASIDLNSSLTLRNSFLFPVQSAESRREILLGALWLLVPVVGWLMNLGHRVQMVHNMQHGLPAWPAWSDKRGLLRHGAVTLAGMVFYVMPGAFLLLLGVGVEYLALTAAGAMLVAAAVLVIPGFMSHYCFEFELNEIFNPVRALRRVKQGGKAYWVAWLIAVTAMCLSFLGLLVFGLGFLVTSVWFWQVAGFSFATVFSRDLLGSSGNK